MHGAGRVNPLQGARRGSRRRGRLAALAFLAALAGGSGALADENDPITSALCRAPDLASSLTLLQPVTDRVSGVLACEPDAVSSPAPVPAPKPKAATAAQAPVETTARNVVAGGPSSKPPAQPTPSVTNQTVDPPNPGIEPVPLAAAGPGNRAALAFFAGLAAGAAAMLLVRRRRVAQADAVERMKSELLSNISHELRTPLTPVRGYAEILRSRTLPAVRVREFAEAILDASEQLESVVNILVSFAAIEAGRAEVHRTPIDLRTILGDLAERWQHRAAEHVITATVPERLAFPLLDGRLVKLAVDQLVDNAIKFSPEGGVVTVRAAVRGEMLEISVADQGIGVARDQLDTIFDSFRQGDGSSTRRFGGLGLGLTLVSRIARIHDGAVRVSSKPGIGSTFTIALPYKTVREIRLVPARSPVGVAVR